MEYRRITQRDFIAAVRETAAVAYRPPRTFRAGGLEITIPAKSPLGRFLDRLSPVLSFEDYDRLARAVWVAHFKVKPP